MKVVIARSFSVGLPGADLRGAIRVSGERARARWPSCQGSAATASANFISNKRNSEEWQNEFAGSNGNRGEYVDREKVQRCDRGGWNICAEESAARALRGKGGVHGIRSFDSRDPVEPG